MIMLKAVRLPNSIVINTALMRTAKETEVIIFLFRWKLVSEVKYLFRLSISKFCLVSHSWEQLVHVCSHSCHSNSALLGKNYWNIIKKKRCRVSFCFVFFCNISELNLENETQTLKIQQAAVLVINCSLKSQLATIQDQIT